MEGVFKGKIKEYGIGETKAGDPNVIVSFEVEEKVLTWYGTLKEGRGQEITVDALVTMGYSQKTFDLLAGGEGLDSNSEYNLTIVQESDMNGKLQTKIKWINPVNSGAMKSKMTKEAAMKKIKMMNLDAALAMKVKSSGIAIDDVPF